MNPFRSSLPRGPDPLFASDLSSNDSPHQITPTTLAPYHLDSDQLEVPGPMSVLEWRRAVWFEVQSNHHASSVPTRRHLNETKSQSHRRKSSCWGLDDDSSNSDSSHDQATDRPSIKQPVRMSASPLPQSTKTRKLGVIPLIDLSQPTDADGRPIQYEGGRPKLVSPPKSSSNNNRVMAAPNIEQRHREAIRRLQAEATEQLIYAEWEANHQKNQRHSSCRFQQQQQQRQQQQPKLHRNPSRKAPLQKLSDFARRSVSTLSIKTSLALDSPPRNSTSLGQSYHKSRNGTFPRTNLQDQIGKCTMNSNRFSRLMSKIGTIKRSSAKKFCDQHQPLSRSPESEASIITGKSSLSSLRFSASTPAHHSQGSSS